LTFCLLKLNVQHGSDLCKIVDVLDVKMMNDLIKWFLKQELSEYGVLFEENQEVYSNKNINNKGFEK
jgi:hypothetical protein